MFLTLAKRDTHKIACIAVSEEKSLLGAPRWRTLVAVPDFTLIVCRRLATVHPRLLASRMVISVTVPLVGGTLLSLLGPV